MAAADLGRGWQLSDRYARALGFARSLAIYHGLALAHARAAAALCRVPRSGRPGVRRRRARRQSRPLLRRPGRPGDRDRAAAGVRRLAAPAVPRPAAGHRARVRARGDAGRGRALRQPAHAHRGDGLAARGSKRCAPAAASSRCVGRRRSEVPATTLDALIAAMACRAFARSTSRATRPRCCAGCRSRSPRLSFEYVPAGDRRGAARRRAARRARALPLQSDHRRAPTLHVARVAPRRRPGRLARRARRSTNPPATSMPGSRTEAMRPAEIDRPRRGPVTRSALTLVGGLRRAVAALEPAGRLSEFGWPWLAAAALEVTLVFALLALVPPLRTGWPGQIAAADGAGDHAGRGARRSPSWPSARAWRARSIRSSTCISRSPWSIC